MTVALLATTLLAVVAPDGARTLPRVHFTYVREASASDCPDGEAVQHAVRGRLGFDPFAPSAELELRARVERRGDELQAVIEMSADGDSPAQRRLGSRRSDCSELAAAMELAVAIAIDPLALARPAPPAAPEKPAPAPAAAPLPPRPAPPAPETREPRAYEVGLGVLGSLGAAPAATVGFAAGAGLRARRWSLSVEGRLDLPGSRDAGGGSISAHTMTAGLVPCVHWGPAGACLVASAGALRAAGRDVVDARQVTMLHVALGARALLDVANLRPLVVRLHLDVLAPVTHATLKVGDVEAWSSPAVSASLGIAGLVRFQ